MQNKNNLGNFQNGNVKSKVNLVFKDTEDGVRAHCPQCHQFSLEPVEFYQMPFVKCSSCGYEAPSSIFDITHEKVLKKQELYPLQYLNGNVNGNESSKTALPPIFTIGSMSSWLMEAKLLPPITPLFDNFWLTGEFCFCFASTNVGKTILAVQIADAISKGAKVQGFDGTQRPMRVCLFDFELSSRQFYKRYSDEEGNIYTFSEMFLRAEVNPNVEIPKGMNFKDFVLQSIEKMIVEHKIEVVIIDNLTALISNITESRDVLELMHKLRLIKLRYDLSMLVLSHTPKRDLSRPIGKNDMAGSMHLLNLCDSAFAIGESAKESNVRYLKQIKCRSAEFRYDSDNVAVFRIGKVGSYISFEHINFSDEGEHLRGRSDKELSELDRNIIDLHKSEPNLSFSKIAERLQTNKMRVSRVLKKFCNTPQ